MSGKNVRNRRAHLMAADPHCRNCGTEVIWFKPAPHQTLPGNFATIEHLNSLNQSRPRPAMGETTLWCLRCNHDRGVAEQAAAGLAVLRTWHGRRGRRRQEVP